VSLFGEKLERKTWLVIGSAIYSICFLLLLVTKNFYGPAVLVSVATPFASIWLFTCYNYTSAAYPTRVRSVGTGWTDGVGHLGTIVGTSLLVGRLFAWTAGSHYYGWILYVTIAGALFPSLLLLRLGQKQRGGILEELST
jgi:MFS family permease